MALWFHSRMPHALARSALGLLLLMAGILKAHELATEPVANRGLSGKRESFVTSPGAVLVGNDIVAVAREAEALPTGPIPSFSPTPDHIDREATTFVLASEKGKEAMPGGENEYILRDGRVLPGPWLLLPSTGGTSGQGSLQYSLACQPMGLRGLRLVHLGPF